MAVAAIGALVSAGSSIFGMVQQNKAMQAQEKAAKEQRNLQMAADAKERRKMLREQAIARGQTVNVASQVGAGQGPTAGTALTGGLSGLENQGLSAMAFQGLSQYSVKRQQKFLDQAARYQQTASIAQGIAGAAPDLVSMGSGLFSSGLRMMRPPSLTQV